MTEEDIEKIIRNNFYQNKNLNGSLIIKNKEHKYEKILGLNSLTYLCKRCYKEGVNHILKQLEDMMEYQESIPTDRFPFLYERVYNCLKKIIKDGKRDLDIQKR